MRFELNIDYPSEMMQLSHQRLNARANFRYVDRVPVGFCLAPRYFAPEFNLPYKEFFKNVETQYYWQLQFAKYRIERIPEDIFCIEPKVVVGPFFDNVINASAFGAEIVWPENETLQTVPTIKSVEEMERMEIPSVEAGLWGRVIVWWKRMNELARKTKITFNGNDGHVEVAPLVLRWEGPHMTAVDLIGIDFYWWIIEYPDECLRFLKKITEGMLAAERNFRRIDPRPPVVFGLAEDCAQIMSAEAFTRFVLPFAKELYDQLGNGMKFGRGMHMCGESTHLHQVLLHNLRITSFDLFGSKVKPEIAAKNFGGEVALWGNIDPVLMLNGTKSHVKAKCIEALEAMAPFGGYMLGDGANVCPGTSLENLAVFTEAAEEYGLPQAGKK